MAIFLTLKVGWGILGLTVATSASSLIHALFLLGFLMKKISNLLEKNLILNWFEMRTATFFTAIFLWLPMRLLDKFILDTSRTINLLILTIVAGFVGFSVYLLFSLIFKIPEIYAFARLVRRLGQWQAVLKESEEILTPTSNHKELGFAK